MKKEIDLKALKANVLLVKKLTGKKLLLPVKADAYGHGLEKVVEATACLVDGFWTATKEEALKARKISSIKTVLAKADKKEIKQLVQSGVEICINSKEEYFFTRKTALHTCICANVHICIDSTMKRFGFDEKTDFSFLKENDGVNVCGVYTHLAKSDLDFIEKTEKKFFESVNNIKSILNKDVQTHLFASPAVETLLEERKPISGDFIRTGLLCYGITKSSVPVRPVMSVQTKVLAVNKVEKGEGVGYGNKYIAGSDGYVLTCDGGYFDGIFPLLWADLLKSRKNGVK